MPDASHLLVFIAAGLLLNLTPGPDVMFIVANAVRAGARAAHGERSRLPSPVLTGAGSRVCG